MPKGYESSTPGACEARVWRALEKGKGWMTLTEVTCCADCAWQTAYQIIRKLICRGLVEKQRVGLPIYYRAKKGPAAREYAARIKQSLAVLAERAVCRSA